MISPILPVGLMAVLTSLSVLSFPTAKVVDTRLPESRPALPWMPAPGTQKPALVISKPVVPVMSTEVRRKSLTDRLDKLVVVFSTQAKTKISLKQILWGSGNFSETQDMAVALFSSKKDNFALVFIFSSGEWKVMPETLR